MSYINYALVIMFALLQLLDVESTNTILAKPGGRELNDLTAWFMKKLGNFWWVVKLPLVGIVAWFGYLDLPILTGILNLGYAAVIAFNAKSVFSK